MNLFNPKGQPGLGVSISTRSIEYEKNAEEIDENAKRNIESIQDIYNDEGGRTKMKNQDLQKKTEEV